MEITIDEFFPEAFETQMISLSDILHKQDIGDEYFQRFGLDKVEWLESPGDTVLTEIEKRFNYQYYERKIACETMESWQIRLQVTTDRICRRYCRALRLMQQYEARLDEDIIDKTTQTSSASSTTKSRTKAADLPDTGIELPDIGTVGYAGSVADSVGSSTDGGSVVTEKTGTIIDQLSKSIDGWRDIITEIIDEYDKCFLKIEWY